MIIILKGQYIMIKWGLSQEYRVGISSENQPMCNLY